jgi:hypothetical protein
MKDRAQLDWSDVKIFIGENHRRIALWLSGVEKFRFSK